MLGNKVSVFGGTGFVGREVVCALAKAGFEVDVFVRRPERYRDLALNSNTKVKTLPSFDDIEQLQAELCGSQIVVNLLSDRSTGTERVEVADLKQANLALRTAMEKAAVTRVLSLSQLGASTDAKSDWLVLQAEIDALMSSTAGAQVTIVQPSLLIGEKDDTTARFVSQLNRMALLMVAQSDTVVQPVWIRDFANVMVGLVGDKSTYGQTVPVAGEERLTLRELAELVADIMQKDAIVFPMCRLNATIMSKFGPLAPIVSVSASQLQMLTTDMVSDQDFETQFGFAPCGLDWVISTYAQPHHIRERYHFFRREAGRNTEERQ